MSHYQSRQKNIVITFVKQKKNNVKLCAGYTNVSNNLSKNMSNERKKNCFVILRTMFLTKQKDEIKKTQEIV